MPTSTEFFKLCQSQVALLTQGMGAALSIIYLTEELTTSPDTQLVPFVAHPEVALNWGEEQILSFLTQVGAKLQPRRLLTADAGRVPEPDANPTQALAPTSPISPYRTAAGLLPKQQMVLPLIYQERVMGLLVTARADRAWNEAEQAQIEHVAQTLTAACILEWRSRWLAQDLQQQQLLEEQKTDLFDNLLHQFRNPLTAVRTFGKLLLKRLRPGDTNRSVAESIVRESDRLQELLKQLDTTLDLDINDLLPLLNSGSAEELQPSLRSPLPSETETRLPDVRTETRMLLGSAIDLQPQAITTVLQPLLDTAAAIAQDRQVTLQSEIPSDLPLVLIDGRALREVLNNLLDNALKYTPAGGQIYVGVQRQSMSDSPLAASQSISQPYCQTIVIADTGPGIPPTDMQHLFERHYRGIQASTNIPGTGLGLAIARDLVNQMKGQIQIFSPAATSGLIPVDFGQLQHSAQKPVGTAAVVWLCEVSEVSEVSETLAKTI